MTQDALEPVSELPRGEFAFPGPLRDALVQAILDGTKTATASLLIEYPKDYQFDEEVGSLEAVLDSHDNVVCIIRTTDMQVCRLADVESLISTMTLKWCANALPLMSATRPGHWSRGPAPVAEPYIP